MSDDSIMHLFLDTVKLGEPRRLKRLIGVPHKTLPAILIKTHKEPTGSTTNTFKKTSNNCLSNAKPDSFAFVDYA